jgi:hypothetical protein
MGWLTFGHDGRHCGYSTSMCSRKGRRREKERALEVDAHHLTVMPCACLCMSVCLGNQCSARLMNYIILIIFVDPCTYNVLFSRLARWRRTTDSLTNHKIKDTIAQTYRHAQTGTRHNSQMVRVHLQRPFFLSSSAFP